MRLTNLCIIISYIYIIIFFSLSLLIYTNTKVDIKKEMYNDKISYACDASILKKFDGIDELSHSQLSVGITSLNYHAMYDEFVRVLKLNFKNNYDITSYLDKYIVVTNEGLYINYKNNEGNRVWSDIINYTSLYKDNVYKFTLTSPDQYIDGINIKRLVIINTIRRNLIIENDNSTYVKIPYDDNEIYNSVLNQSVIATFSNCPIIGNKKINIVSVGGSEIKDKNVYYINDNNRYEKINFANLNEDDIYFEEKSEAGIYYMPELF